MKRTIFQCVTGASIFFVFGELVGYLPYMKIDDKLEVRLLMICMCLGWMITIFTIAYKTSSMKELLTKIVFSKTMYVAILLIFIRCGISEKIFCLLKVEFSGSTSEPYGLVTAIYLFVDFCICIAVCVFRGILESVRKHKTSI